MIRGYCFNANKAMTSRLDWLRMHPVAYGDDVISSLRAKGIVTNHYNEYCLDVDLWFIDRCRCPNTSSFSAQVYSDLPNIDPFPAIWFRVIFMAMLDLQSQRPCDLGSWRGDRPPGGISCQPDGHACADDARDFLLAMPEEIFRVVGVTQRYIHAFCLDNRNAPVFTRASQIAVPIRAVSRNHILEAVGA